MNIENSAGKQHGRTVVLGGAGMLGAAMARVLSPAAIVLTRGECDLRDLAAMRTTLSRLSPAAVINAAGYTKVDLAEDHERECMHINGDAVEALAGVCAELDCPLVQISSDYVFGGDVGREKPYCENDTPAPLSVYGHSKWLGEQAAATWKKHIIMRTCGLYGPRNKPNQSNFVDTIRRLGAEREVLSVVDDQRCTPSYIRDVAAAVPFLLQNGHYGLFHVVNRGATNWCEFAREIVRLAGLKTIVKPISSAEYGARARRPSYSVLDTEKYHRTGGPIMPDWTDALANYLAG